MKAGTMLTPAAEADVGRTEHEVLRARRAWCTMNVPKNAKTKTYVSNATDTGRTGADNMDACTASRAPLTGGRAGNARWRSTGKDEKNKKVKDRIPKHRGRTAEATKHRISEEEHRKLAAKSGVTRS